MTKISIIGAGQVGGTTALYIAEKGLGDIILLDVVEGLPQGKALDLKQAAPLQSYDIDIIGTNDYKEIKDSDLVVVTAGIARKPGMSREDLVNTNYKIIKEVSLQIKKYSSESKVIVVTNPLDVMTYAVWKVTNFASNSVFGMSGVLDGCRFATFIAHKLKVSAQEVNAMVLGGHGDAMVPLPQYTTVTGIPITKLLDKDTINKLIDRTIHGGAEIVSYLKTGSAFYAPAASIAKMVESIIEDKKRIMPVSAYVTGEYGISGIYLGVPVILGKNGVEHIIELDLTEEENKKLLNSAEVVKNTIAILDL
ncbi:MAG: malate dehydrogenase [Methanosarcinales archaeon]